MEHGTTVKRNTLEPGRSQLGDTQAVRSHCKTPTTSVHKHIKTLYSGFGDLCVYKFKIHSREHWPHISGCLEDTAQERAVDWGGMQSEFSA